VGGKVFSDILNRGLFLLFYWFSLWKPKRTP
jgi:hypothetical protein